VRRGVASSLATLAVLVAPGIARAAGVSYQGGSVLHSNRTHVIFWRPAGSGLSFDPGYQSVIETFLARVAADSRRPTNVYGLTGQYYDSGGPAAYDSIYSGAVLASDPLPANGCTEPPLTGPGWGVCLTDAQLQGEIARVVSVDRLPTTETDIYFLVTPDGLGSCTDASSSQCALAGASGYCGYHSSTVEGILYAVIPYNAVPGHCQAGDPRPNSSTADPALSTISHEQIEIITDPEGDAWVNSSGQEVSDLCIKQFGPNLGGSGAGVWNQVIHGGHYYLQDVWSNDASSCQPRAKADPIWFRTSSHPRARAPTSFFARASDPDGAIVSYDWFFGDGGTGRQRRAAHTFKRAGVYRVVLRTTDSAGNDAFSARVVRVSPAR
jgi:hypothetical protein